MPPSVRPDMFRSNRELFSGSRQLRDVLADRVVYHFCGNRDIWNFSLKLDLRMDGRVKYG